MTAPMVDVAAMRVAVADAVAATVMPCRPYPPDTVAPPAAFIDQIGLTQSDGDGYWAHPTVTLRLVTLSARNDLPSALADLESHTAAIIGAVQSIGGVLVSAVESGQLDLNGTAVPAVTYTLTSLGR